MMTGVPGRNQSTRGSLPTKRLLPIWIFSQTALQTWWNLKSEAEIGRSSEKDNNDKGQNHENISDSSCAPHWKFLKIIP